MLGSCFTYPGFKCWAVDLPSQDSSVGQLTYLPSFQLIYLPTCWAVYLASEDSSVGQLLYLPRIQVLGS